MGHVISTYTNPDSMPRYQEPPTFDPLLGFPEGRKERVMQVTEEEMLAMNISKNQRDYCVHKLMEYKKCRNEKFPYVASCAHERHDWDLCVYDDFVLRMKEYEREKRLIQRQARKQAKANREELIA
ncbi:unnamed protein product [Owenia fusiformis]|uniref:NADH dehydrogenase [ubiquinone] 1 beta subcomplex subunit 7 n=1 Tax=Owenia fusiformis TaxID=6347 RepID=A0A8J1U9F3_OWEFU|nr:unnamed protein product [Owenia fusiformis]